MKNCLLLICLMIITTNAMANKNVSDALGEYAWDKRQLIVFTPDNQNERYELFKTRSVELQLDLKDRNLQTWYVIADNEVLLDSVARHDVSNKDFRDAYNAKNNEFRLLLLGYDQGEKLRLDNPNLDKVFSEIDQMPMRIQEMQQK